MDLKVFAKKNPNSSRGWTLDSGNHSRKSPVMSGVPQGTILVPIIFLIYIDDLEASIDI